MSDQQPYEHEGSTMRRLDRVESDVAALTTAVVKVESGLQNVSLILARIESSIIANENKEERERIAKQPKIEAIVAILVTIILAMLAGSWQVSGSLSRLDERDIQRDRQLSRIERDIDGKAEK